MQFISSLKSPQSLSPSQAQWPGIHLPLEQLNWLSKQECTQPILITPISTVVIWKEALTTRWWKIIRGETFSYEILSIYFWYWVLSSVIEKGMINQSSTFPMSRKIISISYIALFLIECQITKLKGKHPSLWILKFNFYFTQKWLTTDWIKLYNMK